MRRAAMVALLVGAAAAPARADEVAQWTELGVSHELTDDLTVTFDQHLRFDQDLSRLESVMPEPGLTYRVKKWLRLAAAYRLQYQRDGSGDLVVRHRVHGNVRLRRELADVRLDYRLQLQEQYRPASNDQWRFTVRNRLDASYRGWKRWIPGASAEAHHDLGDGEGTRLDKLWLTAGLAYDRKRWSVEVFYRAEVPIHDDLAPLLHIIGLGAHREL